jgi:CO/xanthine dehydrogenase FAD-binding subunit
MLLNSLTYHAPETIPEAAKLYATLKDVKILAGGTFLLNSLKLSKRKGRKTPQNVLSLRKIPELKGIAISGDRLIIKAMTTVTELFESPLLTENLSVLKTVCRNISSNLIRNMATVGGNLTCRYTWTELGAAVMALDGRMHFLDGDGQETTVAVEEFFKNAAKSDKLFTHISIPKDKTRSVAYRRVKKSINVDIPLLAVCVTTRFQNDKFSDTRVTVNNGVAFAQRDAVLEDFLNSASTKNGVAEKALKNLSTAIYDTRSDDYKKEMFRVSIQSAIQELVERRKQ